GRDAEAVDVAAQALQSCPVRTGPDADEAWREHVELHAHLAAALLDANGDRAAALRHARACVEHGGSQSDALSVLRTLTGRVAPDARRFTLTIRGDWKAQDGSVVPFTRTFRVLATSEAEAFELVKQFEPPEVRPSLTLAQIGSPGPSEDREAPTGVYQALGHIRMTT
ncbi:MAG: hypothetical protein ACK4N5_06760, partial [Myxococcales bacterium]